MIDTTHALAFDTPSELRTILSIDRQATLNLGVRANTVPRKLAPIKC